MEDALKLSAKQKKKIQNHWLSERGNSAEPPCSSFLYLSRGDSRDPNWHALPFLWHPLCSFPSLPGHPCPSPKGFFLKSWGSCYTLEVQKASPHGRVGDSDLLSSGSIHNSQEVYVPYIICSKLLWKYNPWGYSHFLSEHDTSWWVWEASFMLWLSIKNHWCHS